MCHNNHGKLASMSVGRVRNTYWHSIGLMNESGEALLSW